MTIKDKIEQRNKILMGLKISFKKLIEFKKRNNSKLIILKDNEVVSVNP